MRTTLWALLILFTVGLVYAADTIDIHGIYKNATTGVYINGSYEVNVTLRNASDSSVVYSEKDTIMFNNGTWNYIVGSSIALSEHLFKSDLLYTLKIRDTVFSNTALSKTPYAFAADYAHDAGTLAGQSASTYLDDTNTNADTICAGTNVYLDGEGNCDTITDTDTFNTSSEIVVVIQDYVDRQDFYNGSQINNSADARDADTWNDTSDIRAVFISSANISYDSSTGEFIFNMSCEQITGSADLCDGDDNAGAGTYDWNYTVDGGSSGVITDSEVFNFTINGSGAVRTHDIGNGLMIEVQDTWNSSLDVISAINGSGYYDILIPIDNLQDPATGDTAINFGSNELTFTFTTPTDEAFEIEGQGAFSGDLIHVHQHTGNPSTVTLMSLHAEDPDVLPLNISGVGTDAVIIMNGNVTILNGGLYATDWLDVIITESQISDLTHIGNCSGKDCAIGWGNITNVPSLLQAGDGSLWTSVNDTAALGNYITFNDGALYTDTNVSDVSVGGEASGTVGSITLSNTALDDQYVDIDGDTMTGKLNTQEINSTNYNVTFNGFHIDRYNSTHYRLWGD